MWHVFKTRATGAVQFIKSIRLDFSALSASLTSERFCPCFILCPDLYYFHTSL